MRIICNHCGDDVTERSGCSCSESNLSRVVKVAIALSNVRGRRLDAGSMQCASSMVRTEVEA
jgi:hypothetical protein